jgi:rubredoxin---NAD+ reductase
MDPLVIIGTGLAGYRLGKAFREQDRERALHLITQDDGAFYSKPALSTGLRQKKTATDLVMTTADQMRDQLKASIHVHTSVTGIDVASKSLQLDTGARLAYGQLVLACGAQTITLPLSGDGADAIHYVNNLTDYGLFRAQLLRPKHVCVIGAGLVGSEFANDLIAAGHQVTVFALSDYPLDQLVMPQAGQMVRQQLSDAGVRYQLAQSVARVDRIGSTLTVSSDHSQVSGVDMVLSAVGLRPNVALAKAAGIAVDRGIVVDQYGRTDVPDVYALGDCAQVCGHVRFYVPPILACIKAMACTLVGEPTRIHYQAMPVTVKTSLCPLVVAQPAATDGAWEVLEDGKDFVAHYKCDQQLLGFVLMNQAVRQRMVLQQQLPALF